MHDDELKAKSEQDVARNRDELLAQRAAAGRVTKRCACGVELVMDAKRPEKAPAPKCGACGAALK